MRWLNLLREGHRKRGGGGGGWWWCTLLLDTLRGTLAVPSTGDTSICRRITARGTSQTNIVSDIHLPGGGGGKGEGVGKRVRGGEGYGVSV